MGICENQVVIVTGAGRGLGRSHALELARQGAKVLVNDLGVERDGSQGSDSPAQQVVNEILAHGGEAAVNSADVADWRQAESMIQQAINTWGRLDGLVCNAGFLRDRMLASMNEENGTVSSVSISKAISLPPAMPLHTGATKRKAETKLQHG